MKKLIITCILTLGVASCATVNSSNSPSNLPTDSNTANSEFIGAWKWTNTDGGFGNNIHDTPVSTAKTVQLNLMKDHQFSVLNNGNKVSSGAYDITLEKSIYTGEMAKFIDFDNDFMDGVIKTNQQNQLIISDNHPDGTTATFLKN